MRVEFDRDTCIGMYQCVAEWDAFEEDRDAGKATLVDGERIDDEAAAADWGDGEAEVYVREVPEGAEFDAEMAARVCPVDAIAVFDDDGEQIV